MKITEDIHKNEKKKQEKKNKYLQNPHNYKLIFVHDVSC